MNLIELIYGLLVVIGAITGAVKGFAWHGFLGALFGLVCGAVIGFGIFVALAILVAIMIKMAGGDRE